MMLEDKKCKPCEGDARAMSTDEEDGMLAQLPGWEPDREGAHKIRKGYRFRNFVDAMAFANRVADIAEAEGHHPDLHVSYGRVGVELYTHAVLGLTENDFILAAKIEAMARR